VFGIAVGVGIVAYSAVFYGYYYVKGAPITWTDCIYPSRRANTYQLIADATRNVQPQVPASPALPTTPARQKAGIGAPNPGFQGQV